MWKCQYDLLLKTVLTSTPLSHWFLTWEAFSLSQEIVWRRIKNWAKEKVSGFQIHTFTEASFKLSSSLSANEQLADLSHGFNRHGHSSLCNNAIAVEVRSNATSHLFNETAGRRAGLGQCSCARMPTWRQKQLQGTGSDFIDSPLGRAVLWGACWGHVEGLCFPFQPGSFVGQHQAAPAWADDFRNELFAVYAHFHGAPVLHELLGKLQLFIWSVHRLGFWGEPRRRTPCVSSIVT